MMQFFGDNTVQIIVWRNTFPPVGGDAHQWKFSDTDIKLSNQLTAYLGDWICYQNRCFFILSQEAHKRVVDKAV